MMLRRSRSGTAVLVAVGIMISIISGCAVYDSGYQGLVSRIDRSPAPNAIGGLWYRKGQEKGKTVHTTLLFKSGGQVFIKDTLPGHKDDPVGTYGYSYKGSGVWNLGGYAEVKLANGRLLFDNHSTGEMMVFERVQQSSGQYGSQVPPAGSAPASVPVPSPAQ